MEWELKIEDGLHNKIVYVQDVDADEMVGECYEGDVEDRIARARLIAAAPDLLEAAKWAANYIDTIIDPNALKVLNNLRIAIAKATGDAK